MERLTRRAWISAVGGGIVTGAAVIGAGAQPEPPEGMVTVPGGTFLMGTSEDDAAVLAKRRGYHPSWLGGEVPQREVEVATFAIDIYPVTNAQYAEFIAAKGHRTPVHWQRGAVPDGLADHPVIFVDLSDCMAYAQWAGKRLPTEAEWEKAARGTDGRYYPWGDEFDPDACRWNRDGVGRPCNTCPVTDYPQGASPYGAMHMSGNVAEYCADGPGPGAAYIKGGSWMNEDPVNLRPAARNMSGFANNRSAFYGFRCVKEVV